MSEAKYKTYDDLPLMLSVPDLVEVLGISRAGAYDALHDTLSLEQQKLLLHYLDAEEHFRDEETLDAFVSGFKLADGIRRELGAPYSYEAESESQARKIIQRELGFFRKYPYVDFLFHFSHNHLDFCTYEFEKIRGFLHLIHQFHSRFCFHRAN